LPYHWRFLWGQRKETSKTIKHLSSFATWAPREDAHQWIVYPGNMDTHLSIDEVALSQGELYTVVTNKKFKVKKGSLVAIVAGTKAE
jgi:transposase